jgi:2-polyprenyl-3-methyl-5-hydroxy-6-metoxy-1,4-benzoquinol methylase
MELCTEAAKYNNPAAKNLLDIGCGAGNFTLEMRCPGDVSMAFVGKFCRSVPFVKL